MAELSQAEVVYFIILGTLGMLSLITGFAVFITVYQKRMLQEQEKQKVLELEYQQKMIQSEIDSQEVERKRIASDLHDSIGSLLWAAKLNMAFLSRSIDFSGEQQNSYAETLKILDQTIDSVRRISWELTPEAFNHTGLSASVKGLCARLDGKGQHVFFEESGNSVFWKDDHALMAFRIVQELVNNAVKHSKATEIRIHFNWSPGIIIITVSDNGIGFVLNEKVRNGVGWWNIKHRANKISAEVRQLEGTSGASIQLSVPLSEQ